MEIFFLDSVDSTHTYLKEYIKKNNYSKPTAIVSYNQTNGTGSRNNKWEGKKGNLFFSFVLDKSLLPKDLPLSSTSIYFSFLLKEILTNNGSKVWLKWPNDFYIDNKKIGGTITNLSGELFYCGIGLNLKKVTNEFGFLDIDFEEKFLKDYFALIDSKISWKRIFSKFLVEFEKSRQFKTTINNQNGIPLDEYSFEKKELKHAILNTDGSISIDNKKVYSLR